MLLDEARLKTHTVTREGGGTEAESGLTTPGDPTTFEVLMDLQPDDRPRFADPGGGLRFVGGFVGFTYDDRLKLGDRLYDTPHGALRIEAIMLWDDEPPDHYEIGLVPA